MKRWHHEKMAHGICFVITRLFILYHPLDDYHDYFQHTVNFFLSLLSTRFCLHFSKDSLCSGLLYHNGKPYFWYDHIAASLKKCRSKLLKKQLSAAGGAICMRSRMLMRIQSTSSPKDVQQGINKTSRSTMEVTASCYAR